MKVLVVDDDRVLADLVSFTLRREGFEVIQAHSGANALQRSREKLDLILLDVNLPDLDGFTICRMIREESDTPIILLTVRDDEDDVVHGLTIGADDYIAKPFSPRQLLARAQAVLRRAGAAAQPAALREVGSLQLDPARRELRIGKSEPIMLSSLESRLLDYLLLNKGYVLTTDAIIDHLYGPEGGTTSMIRQLVYRLRGKLEASEPEHLVIRTIPGMGYELTVEGSE